MRSEHTVRTGDGRTLRVVSDGDPDGLPVLMHHGTPGDGSLYRRHAEDARERGLRLIGYDRPGYGGSTPNPRRTVADCAADVAAIADALGLERFAAGGGSGGGPHALACGALLSDRVVAVACLAGVAPATAEGLEWEAGMGADNVAEFEAVRAGDDALASFLGSMRSQMLTLGPEQLHEAMASLLSDVDRAVFTGEFAEFIHASTHNALRDGVEGWIEDDLAFLADWGFAVADVRTPVLLWHGEHDQFVPPAHGHWLAERLPDVDARISPDDGHLTLGALRIGEIHAWLAERLQA